MAQVSLLHFFIITICEVSAGLLLASCVTCEPTTFMSSLNSLIFQSVEQENEKNPTPLLTLRVIRFIMSTHYSLIHRRQLPKHARGNSDRHGTHRIHTRHSLPANRASCMCQRGCSLRRHISPSSAPPSHVSRVVSKRDIRAAKV